MALTLADLGPAWMTDLCRELAPRRSRSVTLHSFALAPLASEQGVLSRYRPSADEATDEATNEAAQAIVGHRLLTLDATVAGLRQQHRLVLKSKAPGSVVRRRVAAAYARLDLRLHSRLVEAQLRVSPSILDDCHTRELHVYTLARSGAPSLRAITPAIARIWLDPAAQIYAVVMELLDDVRHASTLHDLDVWLPADLDCALGQIARVHGDFLCQIDPAAPPPWLLPFAQLHNASLLPYQAELLRYNADTFPELFTPPRVRMLEALLAASPERNRAIAARPLTLIHGDFTPRNLCLKTDEATVPGGLRLCAYDWELAQLHLPQRDVCELLCYALSPQRGWRDALPARLLHRYRTALIDASGESISPGDFSRDLALALRELATFKLLVQGFTHQLLGQRAYFERLVHNVFDGLEVFS
jgi:Phosphotransferase enzyme family